jgi:adenine specific DNA methylase Mod
MTISSNRLPLDIKPIIPSNYLYYGDNLTIMKEYIPPNSVNLIYLDPPFNSQRNYNLIYKKLTGQPVPEQEEAFCDAWELDPEKIEMIKAMPRIYEEYDVDDELAKFWDAWIKALRNTQPRLLAYLLYMTVRLFEMRRILHPHGSIYLHCDPHASHYMKVIMDGIFGHENYRNEISWHRSNPKSHATLNFPNCRDVILRYSKSDHFTFNKVYTTHDPHYVATAYRYNDDKGRYRLLPLLNPNDNRPNLTYEFLGIKRVWRWSRQRMEKAYNDGLIVQLKPGAVPQYKKYLSDSKGKTVTDDWGDIGQASGKETLGYPTQKPIALLERIIQVSSNPGDIVLDPFCGCGTAVYAAHLLNRKWIGCDIAILAIHLVQDVLLKRYGLEEGKNYRVAGVPKSVEAARDLFSHDPRQFQH